MGDLERMCKLWGLSPRQLIEGVPQSATPATAPTAGRLEHERADEEARRRELAAAAAREQSNIEATLHTLETDPMSLAAYEDPHKHDPDPDNAA